MPRRLLLYASMKESDSDFQHPSSRDCFEFSTWLKGSMHSSSGSERCLAIASHSTLVWIFVVAMCSVSRLWLLLALQLWLLLQDGLRLQTSTISLSLLLHSLCSTSLRDLLISWSWPRGLFSPLLGSKGMNLYYRTWFLQATAPMFTHLPNKMNTWNNVQNYRYIPDRGVKVSLY